LLNARNPSRLQLVAGVPGGVRRGVASMAIVWPCPLSVEVYAAGGRSVSVPRQSCPSCGLVMQFWSGYRRSVRVGDRWWRVWICRARCRGCRVSHGLVPSFLLSGRQDPAGVIGEAIVGIAGGVSIGAMSRRTGVAFATVRGWWRRFRALASRWWSGFAALTVELGGVVPVRWPPGPPAAAVAAIGWAHQAALDRHPVSTLAMWGFVSVVCGGALIGTNTNPPWRVFGKRRFIPPSPMTGL
jgi:Domain of unknown function (DUF6431)